ncbi:hypothetical protein [Paraburkholderia sp.]|uniref:hypothetical protein n=1 Tax=Paraburkholderia sp. TaxID=1926495 RepID=UPI002396FE72|nr:hypothetical protein [Paraburkholderia sp.]MDE1180962.1 hypothetical protein [Paraburkholderia sp.]
MRISGVSQRRIRESTKVTNSLSRRRKSVPFFADFRLYFEALLEGVFPAIGLALFTGIGDDHRISALIVKQIVYERRALSRRGAQKDVTSKQSEILIFRHVDIDRSA